MADQEPSLTPLAARMARQAGLELARLRPRSRDGRVGAEEVRAALSGERSIRPPPREASRDGGRRRQGRSLARLDPELGHHYLSASCRLDGVLAVCAALSQSGSGPISILHVAVHAVVGALARTPSLNARRCEGGTRRNEAIDLALAVAVDGGVSFPVLRSADRLRLGEVALEVERLVGGAQAGTLEPEAYGGATFTVSNPGALGVVEHAAVIEPAQAGVLSIGADEPAPGREAGCAGASSRVVLNLSVDARVVDPATGAAFLRTVREFLEDPRRLLL